jgi:fucose 4-O-acetylase-like acetyltransferase
MANSSGLRGATARLVVAISVGVLIAVAGTWFLFSEAFASLERRSAFTYAALGMVSLLAATVWLRRTRSASARRDPLWFLFNLCGALSLVILTVLFLWQGLFREIPPLWDSVGTFSALALVVVYIVLALYRLSRRIRARQHTGET